MLPNSFTSISRFIGGGVAVLLALEVLLRMAPVYSVERVAAPGSITHLAAEATFTYSHGWRFLNARRGRANSQGFHADFDYARDRSPVCVIGDSFVQGLMLTPRRTLGGWLSAPGAPAMVLADGGYSAADYLVAARIATQDYGARRLVIVLVNRDIDEAFEDTYRGKYLFATEANGQLGLRVSQRQLSRAEQLVQAVNRHSHLVRYLTQNLVVQARLPGMFRGVATRFAAASAAAEPDAGRTQRAVGFFLSELSRLESLDAADITLVFDADRPGIYRELAATPDESKAKFMQAARAAGFVVVDMDERFAEDYRRHYRRFDFAPEDGHWNEYGHYVVAQAVAAAQMRTAQPD